MKIVTFSFSLIFTLLALSESFIAPHRRISQFHAAQQHLDGYIAPENGEYSSKNASSCMYSIYRFLHQPLDPDFKDSVKPSLVSSSSLLTDNALLPNPKEGDIVRYPSKWKGQFDVGQLKNMFYSQERGQWMVDITPLVDGKSENVRNIDRKVKSIVEPLENIQPIQSSYIRSENGYKIFYKKNSTEMVLRASRYKKLDENFVFSLRTYNATIVAKDFDNYEMLKSRIIKGTLMFGSIGALVSLILYGPEVSVPFLGGSFAGALYFVLLGKKTDSITKGAFFMSPFVSLYCLY